MLTPHDILDFWFSEAMRAKWFASTPEIDAAIKARYEPLWEAALRGELDHWQDTPDSTLALTIVLDQFPRNILEPKGHERTYYHGLFAIIQRYSNMRPETVTELPGIVMRMNKSRRAGDPYPSLTDLARRLRKMAKDEDRPNLRTAARDIENICVLLGQSSRIRGIGNEESNNNKTL